MEKKKQKHKLNEQNWRGILTTSQKIGSWIWVWLTDDIIPHRLSLLFDIYVHQKQAAVIFT